MEKFNSLKKLISGTEADVTAFYEKGKKAAGTRLRVTIERYGSRNPPRSD